MGEATGQAICQASPPTLYGRVSNPPVQGGGEGTFSLVTQSVDCVERIHRETQQDNAGECRIKPDL